MKDKFFKILIVSLIILFLIVISISNNKKSITVIENSDNFNDILKRDDIVIIDVRNQEEYNEEHIPKAINIPYNELQTKINYSKNKKIIVYSKNDSRSHMAAMVLEKMGYKNIYEGNITKYNGRLITN